QSKASTLCRSRLEEGAYLNGITPPRVIFFGSRFLLCRSDSLASESWKKSKVQPEVGRRK
ncbi:hypothetical protein, partial [Actimicrobium antarcticum]|uniref:hypothetical protein n=1 Tax=Actimicrobium antarcticum TaxID=1051899 RepID=UPI0031E26A52